MENNTGAGMYVTGDTHGRMDRFSKEGQPGAGDYLFICGDFGFLFHPKDTALYTDEQGNLDELAAKPYTICFIDGNHENFDRIKEYPVEEWNGGRVHRIRDNIIHLMRGQVYHINGKTVFTMGGAYSIDKGRRQEGISWWRDELPSNDDYREATRNLARVGYRVDMILTHTAPREIILRMMEYPDRHDAELTGFLEWVMYEVKFGTWYFGHWHRDLAIQPNIRCVFEDIVREEL